MPGVTIKDVDQHVLVKALASFLKISGKVVMPEQADYIKTATFKETGPTESDWFFKRCASIMRHLYLRSPSGVSAFTKIYGGRKRNGTRPSKYCRSSNGCIRKALQALETARLVEKHPDGGRKLSPLGQRDIDRVANRISAKQQEPKTLHPIIITT
ncbi:40S ribosomal protein S19b [Drosophila ficusphila]|uniref:40S ribosomal protein S19b n=1 Tax=Drosophila ficusphila TaxID=30025 RepID=UPI0007E5C73C|nr:40S ribosomal protein S19b [Drosophila ficusphila]XP_017040072.1 40S ribosomal protein S19b [Drosophila ficusphila]